MPIGSKFRRLGVEDLIEYHAISKYELDKNEPPLMILLEYARAAGVCVDVPIDDEQDLPAKLPAKPKHARQGFPRRARTVHHYRPPRRVDNPQARL